MRRVCESVSFLINPCRRWQFPSAKYQNTVYKILTKTTIIALNLLLPIPYKARRCFFSPRKKRYQEATKNIPFPHYSPPCRLHYSSFPFQKKAISRKIPGRKKEDKNASVPPCCCSILFPDLSFAGNRGGCMVGVCN